MGQTTTRWRSIYFHQGNFTRALFLGKISRCNLPNQLEKMVDITKYSKWTLLVSSMATSKLLLKSIQWSNQSRRSHLQMLKLRNYRPNRDSSWTRCSRSWTGWSMRARSKERRSYTINSSPTSRMKSSWATLRNSKS